MAVTTSAPSPGILGRVSPTVLAWSALVKADLIALSKSWVLRGWLIALALTELVTLGISAAQGRAGAPVPASFLLASQLNMYFLVWSTVIIVLSAGSVSLEADIISDSILSRACTRTQYILSKLVARVLVILGIYLVSTGIAGYVAWRYAANDMTFTTMATGIGVVGLSVLLLTALGIAFSVVFNNTIVSVVGLLLLWYIASPIFSFVGAEYLSPYSLTRNLPILLKDTNAPQVLEATAAESSMTVVFSKPLDRNRAEAPEGYVVETPDGARQTAQTATYDSGRNSVTLAGVKLDPGQEVKVTVQGVTDSGGNEVSPAANTAEATVAGKPPAATATTVAGTTAAAPAKPAAKKPARKGAPLRVLSCDAAQTSLKVRFSAPVDVKDAEDPSHYLIECPPGQHQAARAASYNAATKTVLLSGLRVGENDNVKVTVKDVKDADGALIAPRNAIATYTAVTTWKYVLGFGLPAIAVSLLAVVWFGRRDL